MSRGKSLVADAIGAIYCQEAEMDAARDLLDVLAEYGLECFRQIEDADGAMLIRQVGAVRDAIAAFEKATGIEYPKDG